MKTLLIVCALVFLAGCATTYPDLCDLKQPDKQGTGYTKAVFPCKLSHVEGKEKG